METTADKFTQLIEALGKNPHSFSKSIDVNSTSVKNFIDGKSKPGLEILQKILQTYPEVNGDWLIRNNGEMFLKPKEKAIEMNVWEQLYKDAQERIQEMKYTIKLQSSMLGHNVNFNTVTVMPPLKEELPSILKLPKYQYITSEVAISA